MEYPRKLKDEQYKLMKAVEKGDLEKVKKIIKEGCDPNFWTGNSLAASPLYLAALMGNYEMVCWLVDKGGAAIEESTANFFSGAMGQIDIGNFIAQRVLQKDKQKK